MRHKIRIRWGILARPLNLAKSIISASVWLSQLRTSQRLTAIQMLFSANGRAPSTTPLAIEAGAEACSQTQKQHLVAFVATQGLHGGVVHHFGRTTERLREIKRDPATP
jgi:hypothetical protein